MNKNDVFLSTDINDVFLRSEQFARDSLNNVNFEDQTMSTDKIPLFILNPRT